MSLRKAAIHTTLTRECRDWLQKESIETGDCEGEIIEMAIDFYRNNKTTLDEYHQARTFLKELIKKELLEDYAKAKPILKRLIDEEIKRSHK